MGPCVLLCVSLEEELGLCLISLLLFAFSLLDSCVPIRPLITETCSGAHIAMRIKPKWLLLCEENHSWFSFQFSSLSRVRLFVTSSIAACQASLSITNSWSLLKLMSIKSVMPSNHLILCHPLLLLPPVPPSIRVFSNESTLCMRWPEYWSFSFSISPSIEHPGLISFRMDSLDLLAVQGTLKSLLQYHRSKASIFWHSAFYTDQLLISIHDH